MKKKQLVYLHKQLELLPMVCGYRQFILQTYFCLKSAYNKTAFLLNKLLKFK